MDDVDAGPEADRLPGPCGPEPELALADHQVPRRWDDAVELDRSWLDGFRGGAGVAVGEKLLDGVWYIHRHVAGGLSDARLSRRLRDIGPRRLTESAIRAAAYYARGGAKVFASGMIEEINKNLRSKFTLEAA